MNMRKQALPSLILVLIVGPHVHDVMKHDEKPVAVIARRPDPVLPKPPRTPEEWYQRIRPDCTPANVQLSIDLHRPPSGTDGTGYEAACFAVASDVPMARALILGLPEEDRLQAASVVFNVAKTMVEQGRETAAGPLMELVIEFWPNHYVALYEAGVTRYADGDYTHARIYLNRFLSVYVQKDQRADRARRMIQEMAEK
jgi:hypothetical protein